MFEEPEAEPAWEIEARRELAMGNKDNAIKIVRDHTHVGRQEARELVEAWERARDQRDKV
jgi:ribosomal protein L7/L12